MSRDNRSIQVFDAFDAVTIGASGSANSDVIHLSNIQDLNCAFQLIAVAGSGTCKFEVTQSIDGVTYAEPASHSDIAASLTVGNTGIYGFAVKMAPYLKIKCTETGTSDSVTVTAKVSIL